MATVGDICDRALELLKVKGRDTTIDTSEYDAIIEALNDMKESLELDTSLVWQLVTETFALSGNTNPRTFGTGGTFNSARPNRIETANYKQSGQTNDYPLTILESQAAYSAIPDKALESDPSSLYCDYTSPLANVYLWPIPTSGSLIISSSKPLQTFSSTATTLTLPPGYKRMFAYNLAVEIAPLYPNTLTQEVISIAQSSLYAIKLQQRRMPLSDCDPFLRMGGGSYDANTNRWV